MEKAEQHIQYKHISDEDIIELPQKALKKRALLQALMHYITGLVPSFEPRADAIADYVLSQKIIVRVKYVYIQQ